MEKINRVNIVKSFFLGMFIGGVFQWGSDGGFWTPGTLLVLTASGMIGLVIGWITELATSMLPISMAKPRIYFLLNGVISLIVTGAMIFFSLTIAGGPEAAGEILSMLWPILAIVLAANVGDYIIYQETQRRLKKYKEIMRDKQSVQRNEL